MGAGCGKIFFALPGRHVKRMIPRQEWLQVVKNTPLVSLDLIIRDRSCPSRVLLGLRTNEPAKDMWFVPGGVIRKNETLDTAFRRICHDELNLSWDRGRAVFKGVYEHFYDTNFAGDPSVGHTHYVVLAYEFSLPSSVFAGEYPREQHRELRFFSPSEIEQNRGQVHPNSSAYFS
jgi:colanic acid biosynthesis protein WcaH